jgi:hypothetical protein
MGVQAKGLKRSRNRLLVQGLRKTGPSLGSFSLVGKPFTADKLTARLQVHLDALDRIDQLHAQLADAVAQERSLETETGALVRAFRSHLLTTHGPDVVILAAYGFKPPKKTGPKTNVAKVISAVRMRATRLERGTKGKRQRKKIKGR